MAHTTAPQVDPIDRRRLTLGGALLRCHPGLPAHTHGAAPLCAAATDSAANARRRSPGRAGGAVAPAAALFVAANNGKGKTWV